MKPMLQRSTSVFLCSLCVHCSHCNEIQQSPESSWRRRWDCMRTHTHTHAHKRRCSMHKHHGVTSLRTCLFIGFVNNHTQTHERRVHTANNEIGKQDAGDNHAGRLWSVNAWQKRKINTSTAAVGAPTTTMTAVTKTTN